jgi:hypothetical protein
LPFAVDEQLHYFQPVNSDQESGTGREGAASAGAYVLVLVVCRRRRCHAGRMMHDQSRSRRRQCRPRRLMRRRQRPRRRDGGVAAALSHLERHPDPLQLRHAQPSPRLPPRRRRDVLGDGGLPLLPAGLPARHDRRDFLDIVITYRYKLIHVRPPSGAGRRSSIAEFHVRASLYKRAGGRAATPFLIWKLSCISTLTAGAI